MIKKLIATLGALMLASCGGGGSGGSTQANGFPTPNAYVGTWVSDCSNHSTSSNSIFTIANSNGVLLLRSTGQYFSVLDCSGQPVVTVADSRTLSISYSSALAASIPLTTGGPIVSLALDKVTATAPAGANTITVASGSGITLTAGLAYDGVTSNTPGKCFSLSSGSSTCVADNLPPTSGTGAMYAQGVDLYFFDISSTGVVALNGHFRKQ